MKILSNAQKYVDKIPIWAINLTTLISGILTVIPACIGVCKFVRPKPKDVAFSDGYFWAIVALAGLVVILMLQVRKYRRSSLDRLKITSFNYHKLTHECRDLYFDVLSDHKNGVESIKALTDTYKQRLILLLDNLCELMKDYTGQEVCASIKLIKYTKPNERIDIISQTLTTLCRSSNSDTNRAGYETNGKPIVLNQNTDYLSIVDLVNGSGKNYFYQSDLEKYDKQLQKHEHKRYENSNTNWSEYYKGTIVVPIQIEFARLYNQRDNSSYHVIGFLCVDSLSTNAFTSQQETFNVDTLKSYADLLYILLGQYRHYLKKLTKKSSKP